MTAEIGLCEPDARTRINPDWFFAQPGTPEACKAMELCLNCPLYNQCHDYALRQGVEFGIWGGVTREARRQEWERTGGRPTLFDQNYASQIRPLLQERRDRENFDNQNPMEEAV